MAIKTAVILGSGLGNFADKLEVIRSTPYSEIEGFPISRVDGHANTLIEGRIRICDNVDEDGYEGSKVLLMKGRIHLYEGYTYDEILYPIDYMHRTYGIENLIVTNAAGGINTDLEPGDLMLIEDHITSFAGPFLKGSRLYKGTMFPDMSAVYSRSLIDKARGAADRVGVTLRNGVYLQTVGPQYETPAEVQMFRTLGADAVGMSTAVEAAYASAIGINVMGVSCITNMAAGITDKPLSHEEVKEVADRVSEDFSSLILEVLRSID